MKRVAGLLIAISLCACGTPDSVSNDMCSNTAQMYGTWDVELLFDISKPPSATKMIIDGEDNYEISGSFYGSSFDSAEMTSITGYFVIAAETSDDTGKYVHMARYSCAYDTFNGQKWSRGRDFLMSWTAERAVG